MRRVIITIVLIICAVRLVSAQEYKTGLGIRGGFSSGLTLKHFKNSRIAYEGLLTTRWGGFDITGLYEVHHEAFEVNHLNWYYGGGAHIGFFNGDKVSWGREGAAYTVIGIDGILGLEYSFQEIPINIGIDWKPTLNLVGYTGLWSEGGISVRFLF
jgi:hypothetical protein